MSETAGHVPHGCAPDLQDKLERLAAVGAAHDVTTLVLRDPATLAWLLGARVHVPQTLDSACLDVVIDLVGAPRLTVVTNTVEAPRLRDRELSGLPADWRVVDWWEDRAAELPHGPDVGCDRPLPGCRQLAELLTAERRVLTRHQHAVLRMLGRDCAAAATAAALRVRPEWTEYAAAAALAGELLDRAIDPVVLLIAGERSPYRHPLPTTAPLGSRAMLVCCGRRHGLIASITRIVSFDRLRPAEEDSYRRLLQVEAVFLDATRPGVRLGDIVRDGTEAYAEFGHPADEWRRHHQGGFTGSQTREFPAAPSSDAIVPDGSAVAWNPSVNGWKVEDTCIVLPTGPEPVGHDDAWPMTPVAGRLRPDVLVP